MRLVVSVLWVIPELFVKPTSTNVHHSRAQMAGRVQTGSIHTRVHVLDLLRRRIAYKRIFVFRIRVDTLSRVSMELPITPVNAWVCITEPSVNSTGLISVRFQEKGALETEPVSTTHPVDRRGVLVVLDLPELTARRISTNALRFRVKMEVLASTV